LGRIFVLDEVNLAICVVEGLYGVPDSPRAARELADVEEGESAFFYTTDSKRIYGIYKTTSLAYTEEYPEKGPWTARSKDRRFKFYPHRIRIEPVKAYQKPIAGSKLRKFGKGLTNQRIRRGSSVITIDEKDAEKLAKLLAEVNDCSGQEDHQHLRSQNRKSEV
jgi:predicted RNA-binding protein with PUA-like domain